MLADKRDSRGLDIALAGLEVKINISLKDLSVFLTGKRNPRLQY